MPKHKIGAGNYVQPTDDSHFIVFINWKEFARVDDFGKANELLHKNVPQADRYVIISGNPD